MILFLHGTETFLLRAKLAQITDKAAQQGTDAESIITVDGAESTVAQVAEALMGRSLLGPLSGGDKRLVIIRDFLASRSADEAAQLVEHLAEVPKEQIVVVAEFSDPDKRLSAFKKLQKLAEKSWQFAPLEESAVLRWLGTEARNRQVRLAPAAARSLVRAAGTDLWTLSTELDKLSAAAGNGEITEALVEELVTPSDSTTIWELVDALGRKDSAKAAASLQTLLASGEPPQRLFTMIVRQYRILLGVCSLLENGAKTDAAMAKELGVHPFSIQKARLQARQYSVAQLEKIYDELAELDHQMKTGRRDPSGALELFVVEKTTT